MNEMIERVARAICLADTGLPEGETADAREWYRCAARAAIEAMREPTDAMLAEGGVAMSFASHPSDANRSWRAMIDAALA